ncbi:hypothetical protein K431DRAFT_234731 [Polychaeton citri CBS 116435]|uniref:Zn(2)-C6 fungal-type domain-containing protein n=1 Tax=Polychaeton citri CBS 116435 TaxID=1314669 RepID=A0A9P4ULA0_9PEZI|nr:hypothetical protein K431DRAFT_234731 [Polychaeton citri CBS 116435]
MNQPDVQVNGIRDPAESKAELNGHLNEFRPRKSHKKSRGGCVACKKRHIKCSEGRPRCERCGKLSLECVYATIKANSPESALKSRTPSPSSSCHNMAVNLSQAQLKALFEGEAFWVPTLDSSQDLRLLQHFQNVTCATLGSDLACDVLQKTAAKLAWGNAHLMHMVLAISAAHMKRLAGGCHARTVTPSYEAIEAKHWQHGLQMYQAKLSSPNGVRGEFDSIVATTVLSTFVSYAIDDEVPRDVFSNLNKDAFDSALSPLGATSGFRALRILYGEFDAQSSWAPVLYAADDDLATFTTETPGTSGMPRAFVHLCGLNERSNSQNEPYHRLLRLLTPLLRLPYNKNNFAKLMAYMGRTWSEYKPLIGKRDPIALLLLSYWFALLRQMDQWWLQRRARTECNAIVAHLSENPDPRIRALLFFPSSFGEADISCIW